jgi:hypothetical protein
MPLWLRSLPTVGFLVCFAGLALLPAFLPAQTGSLEGRVVNAETQEPLAGATVRVADTSIGAYTDSSGHYLLDSIPVGLVQIKVSYVGFADKQVYEIRIETGVAQRNFALQPKAQKTEEVVITAPNFSKSLEKMVSTKQLGLEQIRANPGGDQDIARVVQSLPGVSGSVGFRNDIIVRGGAPSENVYFIEGIEIPTLNHFATQGSGGGPSSIINSNFIEQVDFQSSAFSPRYDDALSSAIAFDFQEGNSQAFQTTFQVGADEAGVTFDTPIGKNASAIFSVRRSYLQFLFDLIGLPFLPSYWDGQAKLDWQLSDKTSITVLGVGALDRLRKSDLEDVAAERRYILDGLPIQDQNSYTVGASVKHLLPNGYLQVSLSRNELQNFATRRDPQPNRDAINFDYESYEAENQLRLNAVQRFGPWRLNYGALANYATFSNETFQVVSSQRGGSIDSITVSNELAMLRYGVHGGIGRSFFNERLKANLGFRADMNTYTDGGNNPLETLSPRLSVSYGLGEQWAVNASAGIYYKLPPYTILGFETQEGQANRDAAYIRSTHYTAGLEFQPDQSLLFSAEGFFKQYDNYPVSVDDSISLANLGGDFGVFGNQNIRSVGRGRSYGVELFAQKRLTGRLYGTAAYTLYWSEFTGFDRDEYIRSAWDNRHLITLTGGYRIGKNKRWEIAAKWRFLGPQPYTPYDTAASLALYPVAGQGVKDYEDRPNAEESGSFNQLDVRVIKKWFFEKWSFRVFLDFQNVLNIDNPTAPQFTLERNDNNTGFARDADGNYIPRFVQINQSSLVPSIGIRARF